MILSLAAALRRAPAEVEAMALHDACSLLRRIREDEFEAMKFSAQLAGATIR